MSTYSIKDLERISNQKAHTIRIWEQRHGLLHPERTDTNIRYYDDSQLKKLLKVCTLINRGMKISQISKLSKQQMAAEIDLIIADSFQGDVHIEAIINEALIAISTYDAEMFNQLFSGSVKRLGMKKTYLRIIYPLLVRTGLMWTIDDLLPSQEHFLSNLIRQKLFAAIDVLPFPDNPDQTWVLFLNEHEDHEIGLLFANYILRQYGKKVVYLGARVPYADLASVLNECKPTHVYTFITGSQWEKELEQILIKLRGDFHQHQICISGGDPAIQKFATDQAINNISSVDQLINMLNVPYEL
ncbi:MerR family transcriptional regulator [Dyadobacter sp. CY312]|uniref:MerR family transcriptional regulator n=1 Tax=Dyadobacter sp. CY312 TaxID=2907303 RepID=UPI001F30C7CB|nr:MerR family transcriptional regulator [Dyadobacter sp. CY312]MCE7042622.1 MerR family transcriptional regulator [Dyadobacter sp. CY312]